MFHLPFVILKILVPAAMCLAAWLVVRKRPAHLPTVVIFSAIILSAVAAVVISSQVLPRVHDTVTITATGESHSWTKDASILINGYKVDSVKYNIQQSDVASGTWSFYNEGNDHVYGWTPGKAENLTKETTLYLPIGDDRSILFNAGAYRGTAQITLPDGSKKEVDTAAEKSPSVEVSVGASSASLLQQKQIHAFILYAVFLIVFTALVLWMSARLWKTKIIVKLRKNKFLFSVLVKRDFTKKYKRTALGMAWSILSPLLQLLVMWLVFNQFFGNNVDHYVVYLCAGQVVFSFFSDSTNSGMEALMENADIFTKVNVPKYMFLLSKNVSSLINFSLTLVVFFIFVAVDGLPFTWNYFLLLYPIVCLMIFNIGTGLVLSALYVFFRDIQYLWGVFTMLLMYMSAIFYTINSYSQTAQNLFLLNPVYVYIRYIRKIVIDSAVPSIWFHAIAAGYALIMLGIGAWFYKKYNHEFLYYV